MKLAIKKTFKNFQIFKNARKYFCCESHTHFFRELF